MTKLTDYTRRKISGLKVGYMLAGMSEADATARAVREVKAKAANAKANKPNVTSTPSPKRSHDPEIRRAADECRRMLMQPINYDVLLSALDADEVEKLANSTDEELEALAKQWEDSQ